MQSVTISGRIRCFQADKAEVVQFIRGAVSRPDAKKYLDSFQEGSIRHWQDLLNALLLDQTNTALLTFDEAAFIGKELKISENGRVIERLPVKDFKPEKRRAGRPKKKVT